MANPADIFVVGVDGSADASAALAWAVLTAGSGGTVHAVHARRDGDTAGTAAPAPGLPEPLAHVSDLPPADALVEVAKEVGAQMIVVGGHGHMGRRPRMIGSVTHRLLHDADLPVAVVREGCHQPLGAGSTLTVGVGEGHATRAAVDWALGFAARHAVRIDLVHAVHHTPLHSLFSPVFTMEQAMDKAARYLDPSALRRWAEDDLAELAARLQASPAAAGVSIGHRVAEGDPGDVLADVVSPGGLLVMGKHFDGRLTGYFTSAPLHHVLTHAACPVVVVPQEHEHD